MEFTGTVGTSYFRPLRPGIDGQFDAVNAHGTAPCQWKATVNVPWLSMHRDSGTVPADDEHFAIRFNINDRARELRAGNHNAVIRFQVNGGKIYGPKELYITLRVLEACRFELVEAPYLRFHMPQGQDPGSVEPQFVIVGNRENSGDCAWEVTPEHRWLKVAPTRGELSGGQRQQITVSLNAAAATLPARDNHGFNLRFSGALINASVSGQLDIAPPPCRLYVEKTQTEFSAAGPQGGPFTPESIYFQLKNTGGETCNWHTTPGVWLAVDQTSGSIVPNSATTIQLSITKAANSKAPGPHRETITFSAGEASSDTAVAVNLEVGMLPCHFSAGTIDNLKFRRNPDGAYNPASAKIEIANASHREPCRWIAVSPEWLTVLPPQGVLQAGLKEFVTVIVAGDRTGHLAPQQTYEGVVLFLGPAESENNTPFPVSLDLQCLQDYPCVEFHSDRTDILYGENVELTLTMRNPPTRPELTVTLSLDPPSGWSLAAGDFGDCGSGCSETYRIPTGGNRDIQIEAFPNAPISEAKEYSFTGGVEYFYGDSGERETYAIAIPVTVGAASEQVIDRFRRDATATSTPAPTTTAMAAAAAPADPTPGGSPPVPAPGQSPDAAGTGAETNLTPSPASAPFWQDWRVLVAAAVSLAVITAGIVVVLLFGLAMLFRRRAPPPVVRGAVRGGSSRRLPADRRRRRSLRSGATVDAES